MKNILVIGACGQLGTELTMQLRELYGTDNVIASDINSPSGPLSNGPFENLNIMDNDAFRSILKKHNITDVYHLAAILSAKGEQNPTFAWQLNMDSLLYVLEAAKDGLIKQVYWPSSIAVFGPDTPKVNTPQNTLMNPTTVYGISKLAGERWCDYYHQKYGVDVRSLRYPGLIGYKSAPGGGTTDYAVDIFFKATKGESYECYISSNTSLPMMYMNDAVKATIDIMNADPDDIKIRSSYNISGMSFTPAEIAAEIKEIIPEFEVTYNPDFREDIAQSWPDSINDANARADWDWKPSFDLKAMTKDIISNLTVDAIG